MTEAHWRQSAVCGGIENADLFYEVTSAARTAAKALCDRCPVIGACLAAAMREEAAQGGETPEENYSRRHGFRAGLLAAQRWATAYPNEVQRRRERVAGWQQQSRMRLAAA